MDGVTVHERLAGHPGVAEIIMDRTEALNAIDTAMAQRLAQACAERSGDGQVHAIVICAAGPRAFSVGTDLKERKLVPAGTAAQHAIGLAGQMASNSPVAVRAAKRAIRQGRDVSLPAALEVEDAAWRTAMLSAGRREGIAAFVQKREPKWPGE